MDDVRLRDVLETDLEVFHAQEQDREAARRARFPPREREAFLRHWRAKVLGDETVFVQAVTVSEVLAGNVVAWWDGERRFVGYWLGREFWGRGIGTTALRLFLASEPHRPLWADPAGTNTASVRLLERCGFRQVETFDDGHVLLSLA